MLNFYVVSAGCDIVIDTDRPTTCPNKFRAPPLQRKIQKMWVLPKTWVSPDNRLNISDQMFTNFTFGIGEQNKGTTKSRRQQVKMNTVSRRKQNLFFLRESFRLKLSELVQESNWSIPKFENTPAAIEVDQIWLAFQDLASDSNSANFNKNIIRISNFSKCLTTKMPIYDRKSEEIIKIEDLFHTSLKIHNQLTEEARIDYFHSLVHDDALQTFEIISNPNREKIAEFQYVLRRNYVKRQSVTAAKHNLHRLVFNRANQKLFYFVGWALETSKRRVRSCRPSDKWTIHICKNSCLPEEINWSGSFRELHIWTDCVASWKRVRAKWFGSSRRDSKKHCNARNHNTKSWETQTDMSSLQKAGPLPKPVSSTQEPKRRHHKYCR